VAAYSEEAERVSSLRRLFGEWHFFLFYRDDAITPGGVNFLNHVTGTLMGAP